MKTEQNLKFQKRMEVVAPDAYQDKGSQFVLTKIEIMLQQRRWGIEAANAWMR